MNEVNLFDLLALLVVGLAAYFGWRSGLVIQAFGLLGFLGGLGLMVLVAPHVAGLLNDLEGMLRTTIVIVVVAGIVLVAQSAGSAIGGAIKRRLGTGVVGGLDMASGAAFGLVRGMFVVWLIGGLLGVLPLPVLAVEARQSAVLRAIETRVPSPVVLAAELGRILEAAGLPDVFVGAPPPVELPQGGPSAAQAETIAAAARASTLRVEATACGAFMTGTSFAVGSTRLVTNAHVVAGADQVWVSFDGAFDRHPATVVEFDPQLDVAMLSVPGLDLIPLSFAAELPGRGDPAAALGFTGGGRQRLIPAVVSRVVDALGRDIYGQSIVARNVIEMRADIAPGDSGGPLLLADGTVGGVTFSESQADPLIGYALSPVAVAHAVDSARGQTSAVSTGGCISR